MEEDRKVKLTSSDNKVFYVEKDVAFQSSVFKKKVESSDIEMAFPVCNVESVILEKVLQYCKFQVDAQKLHKSSDNVKKWEKEFLEVDQATLFRIIEAANYLNLKSLLDLACMAVVNMIRGKIPEEIRKAFNIKNDYTPEEEAEVRAENAWAFD